MNTQQWLHLSKKSSITKADGMNIIGWYIDVFTEKNKIAPSKNAVTCVFDKNTGLDKFWSEFHFLYEQLPAEKKLFGTKKMPCPLMVEKSGPTVYLNVVNPQDPSIKYKTETFYRKDAKHKYETDPTFKAWFDYAVDLSVNLRIINGIFSIQDKVVEYQEEVIEETTVDSIDELIDVESTNQEELPIEEESIPEEVQTDQTSENMQEYIDPETGEVSYQPIDVSSVV